MKLTDEQRGQIVKVMDESTNYIAMLAAGMRELARIIVDHKHESQLTELEVAVADLFREFADDLEAK